MAIRNLVPLTHKKMRERGHYVTINSNGFTFSAEAIRENYLEDKKSVVILADTDDPYFFAFQFFNQKSRELTSAFKLNHPHGRKVSKTATRQCSSVGIINSSRALRTIIDLEDRSDRTFQFKEYSKEDSIYYIELRPSFEFSVEFSKIKDLSDDLSGIYRCYDQYDNVVYIGSGLIRNEAQNAQKKSNTQFKHIEYSIIPDRQKAFGWERHHQLVYEKKHGVLPAFNKIKAPDVGMETLGVV